MSEKVLNNSSSPGLSKFRGYSHITWYVGNAKQASSFYRTGMGFKSIAYKNLETGSRNIAAHAVSNGAATFLFMSVLRNPAKIDDNEPDKVLAEEISLHVSRHGDGIKDVAFEVDNIQEVYSRAIQKGAQSIRNLTAIHDKYGSATLATIKAYGDTTHTLVQKDSSYHGPFLPGYEVPNKYEDELNLLLPPVLIERIDHCVGNQTWHAMEEACKYYEKILGFHRFWSVDDSVICTEFSALCSVVMASPDNNIKMPINEPAKGKSKSQIEEFVEFYDGPGVQHVALLTTNILKTIPNMKARGIEFISIPPSYYQNLRYRLNSRESGACSINEPLEEIEKNNILVDFDHRGYLLQLFTKPLSDRPTIFIEIIQREGHDGFGAGNFKALFESIEQEQQKRGNM